MPSGLGTQEEAGADERWVGELQLHALGKTKGESDLGAELQDVGSINCGPLRVGDTRRKIPQCRRWMDVVQARYIWGGYFLGDVEKMGPPSNFRSAVLVFQAIPSVIWQPQVGLGPCP